MANRGAASVATLVIKMLAREPRDTSILDFAHKFWAELFPNGGFKYDFVPGHMDADQELLELGLARMGGDGYLIYRGDPEFDSDLK